MSMNNNKNPFVGPVPCSELDAMNFYGRDLELRDLLQKVRTQALTIITAESGAGKTSLINAGLIPALRYLREGDADGTGFALYVGIWGIVANESNDAATGISLSHPAHIFRQAVKGALDDLRKRAAETPDLVGIKQLKKDLDGLLLVTLSERYWKQEESMNQKESASLLVQLVRDFKRALQGNKLILIVDQAEEFMGSGVGAGRGFLTGALSTLASLLQIEDVKVIISLREEYMGKLRLLEGMYMPLAPRLFHLYPLAWINARQALCQVASSSECVEIGDNEMDEILEWANSSYNIQTEDKKTATVDMLSAQAFLSDIYDRKYASMKGKAADGGACHMVIDSECLRHYKDTLKKEEPRLKEEPKDLYIGGLLRWIDKAFEDGAVSEAVDEALARRIKKMEADRKADKDIAVDGALIRRIAANMGTVLATPRGFKSHISRGNLIFHAIRRELAMCINKEGSDKNSISDKINEARKLLGGDNELSETGGYSKLAVRLGFAGNIAADLLMKFNVLKPCGKDERGSFILSLQHDGYASAMTEWCNDTRRREDDVLVPGVGVYGMQIARKNSISPVTSASTKQLELKDLRWEGCFVDDVRIEDVQFVNCCFNACFWTKCTFHNCTFTNCQMNGACFMGGKFVNVKFDNCSMLGIVVKSLSEEKIVVNEMKWKKVTFVNCNLSSAVFSDIILVKKLLFEKSKAHFAQLYKFKLADEAHTPQITAQEFDMFGALFQDFDEEDKEHFVDCKHFTKYTKKAPPRIEKSQSAGEADS